MAQIDGMRPSAPRGFTLIELLIVVVIIGILAAIANPRYQSAKDRALAAQVVAEVQQVRAAAFQAYSDNSEWPEDAPPGVIPADLVAVLGSNYPFTRADYTLDWDIVEVAGTLSAAVVIRTLRTALPPIVRAQLGPDAQGTSDANAVTYVVERVGSLPSGGGGGGGTPPGGGGGGGTPPGGGGGTPPGGGGGTPPGGGGSSGENNGRGGGTGGGQGSGRGGGRGN
jgi:prepilin-type N-terminal cleavage/methylation domain-containing protein